MNYTIHLSDEELQQGIIHPNTLKMARHFFKAHGFLKIDNLFPKELIASLRNAYEKDLSYDQAKQLAFSLIERQ